MRTADDVYSMSLGNLEGEYASVIDACEAKALLHSQTKTTSDASGADTRSQPRYRSGPSARDDNARGPTLPTVADVWRSVDPDKWNRALERYWQLVQPRNIDLEHALDGLDLNRIRQMTPQGWYDFLRDEYCRWKYTAPNRYATTTSHLRKYEVGGGLDELDDLREQLLSLNPRETRKGLNTATRIRGLGTAGASGLLSLLYPKYFATVDQFVVKALRSVPGLSEAADLARMNPENLSLGDGAMLIELLARKAAQNNEAFSTSTWTPRKIDMVLWTYGR